MRNRPVGIVQPFDAGFGLVNRLCPWRWWLWLLLGAAGSLGWVPARAQIYIPGQSYFGRSNYIEYIAGDLPVIISAPHGGALTPAEISDRDCTGVPDCSTATDSNTADLAARIRTEVQNQVGHVPHIIICHLKRTKVDCNREIDVGAMSNVWAMVAWNEFQDFIAAAKTAVSNQYGKGFYIDLHGHGHTIQRLELGYLLSATELGYSDTTLNSTFYENQSSIRKLSQQSPLTFPQLLRGSNSFGALIEAEGYPAVPSPDIPDPDSDPYFNGGYNTVQHGSVNGGVISGLQIECNMTGVRDSAANRTAYAQALARVFRELPRTSLRHQPAQRCCPSYGMSARVTGAPPAVGMTAPCRSAATRSRSWAPGAPPATISPLWQPGMVWSAP